MRLTWVCFAVLAGALASASLPVKSIPKSSNISAVHTPDSKSRVENYVSVLKKDIEAQEATLRGFVNKVELERSSRQKRLVALTAVMNHLHEQLLNTTKYYHEYNSYVGDTQAKLRPLTVEYDRANALYTETRTKLLEEKKFLETLLSYIKNRQRC